MTDRLHRLVAVEPVGQHRDNEASIYEFPYRLYGSLVFDTIEDRACTLYWDEQDEPLVIQKKGRHILGYFCFSTVKIDGPALQVHAVCPVLDKPFLPALLSKETHRHSALFFQHLAFDHLSDNPFPRAQSLMVLIEIAHQCYNHPLGLEQSLLWLMNKTDDSLFNRLYLILAIDCYSKLFDNLFPRRHRAFLEATFWYHLSYVDENGRLYLGHNVAVDEEEYILLQALSVRVMKVYQNLMSLIDCQEISLKAMHLYQKSKNYKLYPLTKPAAAQVVLSGIEHQFIHLKSILKDNIVDYKDISFVHEIIQALRQLGEQGSLTQLVQQPWSGWFYDDARSLAPYLYRLKLLDNVFVID